MNASASRIESYRNSEGIKTTSRKAKQPISTNIPPPPSTTVKSLKSDTPRPETSSKNEQQNGHQLSRASKIAVQEKRKSNGHPPSKPGTSTMPVATAETTKIPTKRRKIETTPQKPACPMDLIMDEMNNLESQKRKAKKKEDSDSESIKGMTKSATPLPGAFKAPTYLDLLRIESDNSMVFEFLNKRVPSVCEMVLAYKMLKGRVENFNLKYFDSTKIKNLQHHIPPDAEILQELRGPEIIFEPEQQQQQQHPIVSPPGRQKGPRTPSGSPPSPTPPPEEKNVDDPSLPAGFIPDMDQSFEAQEQRRNEVKKYLAKRVNKDIKDVEGMLTESHWKLMGALKKELIFTMIDQMVEAATNTSSNVPEGLNSTAGNSARNSVAMDISSNSSSMNEKFNKSKSTTKTAVGEKVQASTSSYQLLNVAQQQHHQQQSNVTNLVTGGFQIYGSQPPIYHQHSYPPSYQPQQQPPIMPTPAPSSSHQQQIQSPQKVVQQQQQQIYQTPIQAIPPAVYPHMQGQPSVAAMPPPQHQQQQQFRPTNSSSAVPPIQQSPSSTSMPPPSIQPRFTPLPNSTPNTASSYFPSTTTNPPPRLPTPVTPISTVHVQQQNSSGPSFNNNTTPSSAMQNINNNNNFKKQNKRGGAKMNKSQKRFQDFNNSSSSSQPKGLDPKFAKLDMDIIRTMPPPPIPKMILEENQKNLSIKTPPQQSSTTSTVRFRPPTPNATNVGPPQQQQQQTPGMPLQRPPQNNNGNENIRSQLPPPIVMQAPEIRPSNLIRPGPSFSSPQRPNNIQPPQMRPPPPRMNNNNNGTFGPYPSPQTIRPTPSTNMQRPMLRPSMPTPDSSSVMRTLFSALQPTTSTAPSPSPLMQQQQQPQRPPRLMPPPQQQQRQQFRPPINQSFMPRMPMHPKGGSGPPRFRPRQ